MSPKSERITILGTPEFKMKLESEAEREGISVSELIRRRCEPESASEEETLLKELIAEVLESVQRATVSLEKGVYEAERTLEELRST